MSRLAAEPALGHTHRSGGVDDRAVHVRDAGVGSCQQRRDAEQHQRHGRRDQTESPQQHTEQQHTQRGQRAQGVHSGDDEKGAASGVADEHPERNRNQRREDDCDHRVLKVLEDAGADPGRTAPVGGGEDEGQRLLQEVHAAAPAFGLAVRADAPVALVHGVSALPANMISVSMTIASTKMAMMPAMIWSLLLAW